MKDINSGYDRWLTTPPDDEGEQQYCEYCNSELEWTYEGFMPCNNPFCPEKFEKYKGGTIAVVMDMAEHLAEVEEKLKSTQSSLKYVRNSLAYVEGIRQERENNIEALGLHIAYLESMIDKHNEKVLTQSQNKGE
jgi:hypothetical protein